MKRIRLVLGLDATPAPEAGFTLIEVVIAILVFTIISLVVAASITNALVIARDSRSRTVAINLASQDLDLDRAVTDVFAVQSETWTTTVQGVPYTIKRSVEWHSSSTTATACGSGTGTLQYKVVTDTVSFPGAGTTNPVVSSTVLAPNSRINDPTDGTIIVAVTGASGAGVAGVSVSITPATTNPNGATAVATPAVTDSNGCTYALKVTPGNYTVSISTAQGIDITQNPTPTTTPVVVTAGLSSSLPFTYDTAASMTLKYASNYSGTAYLPTNLDTTFSSTVGGVYTTKLGSTSPATISLFPFTGGYTYMAGAYVAPIVGTGGTVTNKPCVNVDPGAWTTPNTAGKVGASFRAGPLPGASATVNLPMGVVTLPASSGSTGLQATAVNTTANGDPGCASGVSYTFAKVTSSGAFQIALPFGTWKITNSSAAQITPSAAPTGGVVNANGTVTLDPRGVTP